jgi:hypothetical protein
MPDLLLYVLTAAIPVIAIIAIAQHIYRRRHPLNITLAEWLEVMRSLEQLAPPKRRFEGKPGISTAARKPRTQRNLVEMKKTGTKR